VTFALVGVVRAGPGADAAVVGCSGERLGALVFVVTRQALVVGPCFVYLVVVAIHRVTTAEVSDITTAASVPASGAAAGDTCFAQQHSAHSGPNSAHSAHSGH